MPGRRLRSMVLLALAGAAVSAGIVLRLNLDVDHDVVALITPGAQSAAAPVLRHDFPDYTLHQGVGHDGQSFYVIAREPMHLQDAARWTDRPRYRLQRILLPVLAWITHPQGGSRGLVISLWAWALVGVALTGIGAAALAQSLGASARAVDRLALLVPLLPAALATLDLSVADELGLGLAVCALALDAHGEKRSALLTAVLAVLTKEVALLVFLGWALRRGRPTLLRLVAAPAAVAMTWWLVLRVWFWNSHEKVYEFSFFRGLIESVRIWLRGDARISGVIVVIAVALGIVAIARRGGLRHPLGPIVALQLAFVPFLSAIVLAGDWNGTRATAPLLLFAVVALTVPVRSRVDSAQLVPA